MAVLAHSLLNQLNWPYSIPEDRPLCAVFSMSMSAGDIPVTLESLWESPHILIYLKFSLIVPENRRGEVAMLIATINSEIPFGSWHINLSRGDVWFRIGMRGGTDDDAGELDRYLELARKVFADWQKPISVVLSSDIDSEKAFLLKLLIDMENPEGAAASLLGRYRP